MKILRLFDLHLDCPFSLFVFYYDISNRLFRAYPLLGIGCVDEYLFAGRCRLDESGAFSFVEKENSSLAQYHFSVSLRSTAVFGQQRKMGNRSPPSGAVNAEESPQKQMKNKNDFHVRSVCEKHGVKIYFFRFRTCNKIRFGEGIVVRGPIRTYRLACCWRCIPWYATASPFLFTSIRSAWGSGSDLMVPPSSHPRHLRTTNMAWSRFHGGSDGLVRTDAYWTRGRSKSQKKSEIIL